MNNQQMLDHLYDWAAQKGVAIYDGEPAGKADRLDPISQSNLFHLVGTNESHSIRIGNDKGVLKFYKFNGASVETPDDSPLAMHWTEDFHEYKSLNDYMDGLYAVKHLRETLNLLEKAEEEFYKVGRDTLDELETAFTNGIPISSAMRNIDEIITGFERHDSISFRVFEGARVSDPHFIEGLVERLDDAVHRQDGMSVLLIAKRHALTPEVINAIELLDNDKAVSQIGQQVKANLVVKDPDYDAGYYAHEVDDALERRNEAKAEQEESLSPS